VATPLGQGLERGAVLLTALPKDGSGQMSPYPADRTVLVVGAGIAGLTAAARLRSAGLPVTVVDKGRGVGGRMATRRRDGAVFDHGAQYFTAREERFRHLVESAVDRGAVTPWTRESGDEFYRGTKGMTSLPKLLADGLDVEMNARVVHLARDRRGWTVQIEDGRTRGAMIVLLTAPIPQTLQVLDAGGTDLPRSLRERLERVEYAPCIAALATLDGASGLPSPGFLREPTSSISWIADNRIKGVSETTAITIHSTPAFAAEHFDEDLEESAGLLLSEARSLLASPVAGLDAHRWRYSLVTRGVVDRFAWNEDASAPIFIAGDAFGGPRVEGAALSGLAAADAILELGA
jgi:predicted NAD/FAD-dependent oxidoreductase